MTLWQLAVIVAAAALLVLVVLTAAVLTTVRSLLAATASPDRVESAPERRTESGRRITTATPRVRAGDEAEGEIITPTPVTPAEPPVTLVDPTSPVRLAPPSVSTGALAHGLRTAFAARRVRREAAEARATAARSSRVRRGGGTEKVGQQR